MKEQVWWLSAQSGLAQCCITLSLHPHTAGEAQHWTESSRCAAAAIALSLCLLFSEDVLADSLPFPLISQKRLTLETLSAIWLDLVKSFCVRNDLFNYFNPCLLFKFTNLFVMSVTLFAPLTPFIMMFFWSQRLTPYNHAILIVADFPCWEEVKCVNFTVDHRLAALIF